MSDRYRDALLRLSHVAGVQGALVVEAGAGVPVASELAVGIDGGAVAALTASLYRRAQEAALAGGYAPLDAMQLDAEEGHVLVASAGDVLVIAVAAAEAQLGLVRLETQRAAESLQ